MPVPSLSTAPPRFQIRDATVVENRPLCAEHWRLTLQIEGFPPSYAGQFLQVLTNDPDEFHDREWEWNLDSPPMLSGGLNTTLRRAFSIASRTDDADVSKIQIIHRVIGVGTDWLSKRKVDDIVSVVGPLGRGFVLPKPDVEVLLVGGGVGIPPMIYLAQSLAGRRATAFCGAMRHDLLPLEVSADRTAAVELVPGSSVRTIITTDDGSLGRKGFVTDALADYVAERPDQGFAIFACGPEPMLKAVAALAARLSVPCQVCIERTMACGLGTCQSCVVRIQRPGDRLPAFRLTCTDGPVFAAETVLW